MHHLRLDDLLPGERQQLLRQRRRPLPRSLDLLHFPVHRGFFPDLLQQEFAVPRDHRQEVVEVVRHAPRQATHRLHLHRLLELRLQLLLLDLGALVVGDVAQDALE